MLLETLHMIENTENSSVRNDSWRPADSSSVAREKSIYRVVWKADNVVLKRRHLVNFFRKHQYTAVCRRIISPMIKTCIYSGKDAREVQLATPHINTVWSCQALVAASIVKVVATNPFSTWMKN